MKHDMFKVIVDCYRLGSKELKQGRKKEKTNSGVRNAVQRYLAGETETDLICTSSYVEEPVNKEKIRPVGRGVERKLQGDRTAPLMRYLNSQVGRLWNDVYSEIRENVSIHSTMQMHLVQHANFAVETSTYLGDDGRVYSKRSHRSSLLPDACLEDPTYYGNSFYVHPVTKVLCVSPQKPWKEREKEPTRFVLGPLVHYRKINGEWCVVEFEKIPRKQGKKEGYLYPGKEYREFAMFDRRNYEHVADALYPSGISNYRREEEYGFVNIRAISCRPLGKRELKKLAILLKG